MLTTVRRSRPKGPLRAVPGATNNRKIGGRLCYCDTRYPDVYSPDHVALFENSPKVPMREITKPPRTIDRAVLKNESVNHNK